MITRQEFPYLQELLINDAYAAKNLRVPVFKPGQEFWSGRVKQERIRC